MDVPVGLVGREAVVVRLVGSVDQGVGAVPRGPRGRGCSVALAEAARALTALGLLPERELTESGAVLTARLWGEWAERHGG